MATSPIYSWPEPDNTDLVKNGALAIRTLGNAIDTTMATMTPKTIVDAKGDLIAASAADTPARLAVGNNGETLVADSSTSTGLRYQALKGKNCLYNSAMQVWQRGTSFTVLTAGGEYTADRWYAAFSGIAGRTLSRQAGTAQFQYVMRVARDSGNSNTTGLQIGQSLEIADATLYAGQTVTFSYYARKGANYSATSDGLTVNIFSGTSSTEANRITTAYAAGGVTDLNVTTTLTSSLTRFSHTITLGASVTQFAVKFTFTPTGTAGAADYFEITGLQFEVGSVPTTYNPMGGSIQGELAACQRYYFRAGGDNAYQYLAGGLAASSTDSRFGLQPPVSMRVAPTSLDYSTLATYDVGAAQILTVTNLTVANASKNMTSLTATVASGLTNYHPLYLITNNSTSGYVGLSAEL